MKIERVSKNRVAATIVETVMASTILCIMAGGIINSINYGLFVMQLARENQRATQIMLEMSEAVRLYNWDQVTNSTFIPSTFTNVFDPQSTGSQGVIYYGNLHVGPVTNLTSSYAENMRQFTIGLQWTTGGRVKHNRSLTTYVAKDGMQNYVY